MWKCVSFLLLPLLLICQELEVRLPTRSPRKALYLSQLHSDAAHPDWRYLEELRASFAFDLDQNGFCRVLATDEIHEEKLGFPDVRASWDSSFWKKEKIPFVCTLQMQQNRISLTLFQSDSGTVKQYAPIALTKKIEEDRRLIHKLADQVQKDLFGREGIASLQIIYSQRVKNPDPKSHDWISEIWVCDADGQNERQITHEKSYCLSPAFLPSSKSDDLAFTYVSYKIGQPKIYRATLSQPQGQMLISLRGNQALPALNRTGNQIAFITDVAGRPDLFLQNLDAQGHMQGKARQLFSSPRATQASPTFSPDGKQIAFVSDKDGPPRIYVLPILSVKETQKPQPRLLTRKNRENTSPAWSPDGTKLAYSAKVDGVRQIWIYDFQTEEEVALTTGPENKENPSWAPDSLHLVYNTESDDTCELYLINTQDPEPVQISKGPGQKRFASWQLR